MHGVKIGAGIGTDCVWVRKAIKNLVTWSKNLDEGITETANLKRTFYWDPVAFEDGAGYVGG
jgi:hypothetical protein